MQNIMSNMMPSGPNGSGGAQVDDGVPWWMKYAGKAAGVVGGVVAIIFGLMAAISLSPMCIVAGIWQILAGFLMILIEAPFCCLFLDFVQQFSTMVEGRPVWQKAVLYLAISLVPLMLCRAFSTFIGSACIFVTAIIFGMMTLGRNISLPAVGLCFGLSTLVGSGLIFGTAVLHGMQVIGKRGASTDGQIPPGQMGPDGVMGDDAAIIDNDQQYGQQYP